MRAIWMGLWLGGTLGLALCSVALQLVSSMQLKRLTTDVYG